MVEDIAIRQWTNAVHDDNFTLDINTFLITSLIPFIEFENYEGETIAMVRLSTLRKYAKHNSISEGCKLLVAKGYAEWKKDNGNIDGMHTLILGTTKDYINIHFYYQKISKLSNARLKTTSANKTMVDFSDIISTLDSYMAKYVDFCDLVNVPQRPLEVFKRLKAVIDSVTKAGTLTQKELRIFLDCVNAVVNSWVSIPSLNSYNKSGVESNTAKKLLHYTTPANTLRIIVHFVIHHPKTARRGYEETSLYNLNFQFKAVLQKLNSHQPKHTKYDTDDDL